MRVLPYRHHNEETIKMEQEMTQEQNLTEVKKLGKKVTFENKIILRFISNLWLILVLRSHTIFNQIENDVKAKLIVTPYR